MQIRRIRLIRGLCILASEEWTTDDTDSADSPRIRHRPGEISLTPYQFTAGNMSVYRKSTA